MSQDALSQLREFFSRDGCRKAVAPLSDGIEIAIHVNGQPSCKLLKRDGRLDAVAGDAQRPDMTFTVGERSLAELIANSSNDVGEIGVAILKLMAHEDPQMKIRAKVHIGAFDLLRHGYFSVLPLGGATVAKFLASKGFNGLGKIKEGLARMRD